MIEVKGKYNKAVCFTEKLAEDAEKQIRELCDRPEFRESVIRIMPDVHIGMGCTIGTTMTIKDKIVPAMVGVDIGCGMETVKLADKEIDYPALDALIYREIPCGFAVRQDQHILNNKINLEDLRCKDKVRIERAKRSIGTLGGGNHFIEVGKTETGELYLTIHSGSRNLGKEVAEYYQDLAYKTLQGSNPQQLSELIAQLKASGRSKEIQSTLSAMKTGTALDLSKNLCYLSGVMFDDYLHDMKIVQYFAELNRQAMVDIIVCGLKLNEVSRFTTIHNYIDTELMILRKGAVSAKTGEMLLIPINMKEGSLICLGKGNAEWNYSSPHGAGRLMSRREAFHTISLSEYEESMTGIYTSSINSKTLDEAPMAYKDIDEIIANIEATAMIIDKIVPTYNFKAAE